VGKHQEGKKRFRLSLSTAILIGLALGIACGLFFGEACAWLGLVGRAYIGLLQMSILPYMMVSLIGGIGSLVAAKAIRLAVTGGVVLLASWLLAFVFVFLTPLAFPVIEEGSFFSPSLTEIREVDFIGLYVPVNPFQSMAETVVPAVAVFSVIVGIALIGIEGAKKRNLLQILDVTSTVLTRVAVMVIRLAPFGIFAIAANAAGTMTPEELGRLQVYVVTFILATLVLTFGIMPGIVAVLTPFSYGDVLRASRAALITGFVTGNLFIVLPILIENGKRLFEERGLRSDDTDSFVEVLIPVSFNFPNLGKLLTLLFVLFAGWYTGNDVAVVDYPMFSIMGLLSLFGGVDLAIPFLLNEMRIPSDMYQLYVVTGVANGWFATLLAVMNLFAFTLIATCAATGTLRFNKKQFLAFVAASSAVMVGLLLVTRMALSTALGDSDVTQKTLMHMRVTSNVETNVYQDEQPSKLDVDADRSRLAQIVDRGMLRVGYHPDMFPFCFFNDHNELVGLDVALMHMLADELGVRLEFVEWDYDTREKQLTDGEIDVAIGGLIVNAQRLASLSLSRPYMGVTTGIVVADHRRDEFESWDEIRAINGLTLAVLGTRIGREVHEELPSATVIPVDSPRDFFDAEQSQFDAMLMTAEGGFAYTILHPEYDVAIPEPHIRADLAFIVPKGDRELADFLSAWIELKRTDGSISKLYDKWILGIGAKQTGPRWCIIRDVLEWVE